MSEVEFMFYRCTGNYDHKKTMKQVSDVSADWASILSHTIWSLAKHNGAV